jgi:hypothetical protein
VAKLRSLPELEVIKGFRGILDFYVHKGIPCARRWPRRPRVPRSPASQQTAALFATAVKAFSSADASVRAAAKAMVSQSDLTWRDAMLRAYWGLLIDAMTIDVKIIDPGTIALEATLQAVLAKLDVDLSSRASNSELIAVRQQTDKLDFDAASRLKVLIDAITSALEVTQTTPANLAAALHAYDGSAWRKVPLPFGFTNTWLARHHVASATAGTNLISSDTVPSGQVWILTHAVLIDWTSTPTAYAMEVYNGSTNVYLPRDPYPASGRPLVWDGKLVLTAGYHVDAYVIGATSGDELDLTVGGYKITIS